MVTKTIKFIHDGEKENATVQHEFDGYTNNVEILTDCIGLLALILAQMSANNLGNKTKVLNTAKKSLTDSFEVYYQMFKKNIKKNLEKIKKEENIQ